MVQRMMMAAVVAVVLAGCATAPGLHSFDNSRAYNLSYDHVWANLIERVSRSDMQIKTIAKDSGLIVFEPANAAASGFADCGWPGLENVVRTVGIANIFVRANGGGSTTVIVNASFRQQRMGYVSIHYTLDCTSTGLFEATILDGVR